MKPQNYLKFIEFTENVPKTIQIKEQYKDTTINIVLDTLEKQKQALVFCNSKRSAEKTAEDISYKVKKITDA